MPVSGIVISLEPGPEGEAALARLQCVEELTLGSRVGNQLPAALAADDVGRSRDLHDQIGSIQGVAFMDVVYVNFETA